MLALRVGTSGSDDLAEVEEPEPRARAQQLRPAPTATQRRRVRRIVQARLPAIRHRLGLIPNALACKDPESALETIASIRRECARIEAETKRVLASRRCH